MPTGISRFLASPTLSLGYMQKRGIPTYKRLKLDLFLYCIQKRNSKCVKDLDVTPKTIKIYKGKREKKLHDIDFSNSFLDMLKTKVTKVKINKLSFSKTKKFYASKGTINRMKRHPTEWEKMFVNHVPDKGLLIFRLISSSYNSTTEKQITD